MVFQSLWWGKQQQQQVCSGVFVYISPCTCAIGQIFGGHVHVTLCAHTVGLHVRSGCGASGLMPIVSILVNNRDRAYDRYKVGLAP